MLHFLLFLACSASQPVVKDSGSTGNDSSTDTSTTDSGTSTTTDSHVCDDSNEDCDVGTCRGDGIDMLPGANCLNCHTRGGDREAPTFTAAGTVFTDKWGTSGQNKATVRITDKNGKVYEQTTVREGNFRFQDNIAFPATVEVETAAGVKEMNEKIETGACNSCHSCTGSKGEKLYGQQ